MSNICKTCGDIVFQRNETLLGYQHKCPPKWWCIDPENHGTDWENATVVYAYDAEDAAQKAAAMFDNGDGGSPRERVIVVSKHDYDGSDIKKFNITFEYSVDYHAREAEAA